MGGRIFSKSWRKKSSFCTLVYLTVTQELLQQASERFRAFGAHNLHVSEGAQQ